MRMLAQMADDRRYCAICDNWSACECPSGDAETKQG